MNYVIDGRRILLVETGTELDGLGPELIGAPPGRKGPDVSHSQSVLAPPIPLLLSKRVFIMSSTKLEHRETKLACRARHTATSVKNPSREQLFRLRTLEKVKP